MRPKVEHSRNNEQEQLAQLAYWAGPCFTDIPAVEIVVLRCGEFAGIFMFVGTLTVAVS